MKTVWTNEDWAYRFEESRVRARVCNYGVILSLGLIGITEGRG